MELDAPVHRHATWWTIEDEGELGENGYAVAEIISATAL